jgi:hypothetical protein
MEKELNISAILKDKPVGTKLWSPIFGNCVFSRLSGSGIRVFPIHNGFTSTEEKSFFKTGQYTLAGEVCLFPSKQMRDWHKFAWKKGDVLVNSRGLKILFDRWANDNYTSFYAKTINLVEDAFLDTNLHTLASETEAKSFIKCIEEKLGGKLNLETLEIEKQHEFKDGDILYSNLVGNKIFIAKIEEKGILHSYVYMDIYNKVLNIDKDETFAMSGCIYNGNIRLATDSEKQQLFSALEKKNKRWNPDTKNIEDLPKKYEFKPFDKVLVRGSDGETWIATLFGFYDKVFENYVCIGNVFGQCIPYNEETKHLLGTTDEWKGGE